MEIKQLKPRFVIEKCSLITQWAWDTINDSCPICRNSVNEDSITNENNPVINSVVVVGMCGHAFHYDCIDRWLKNSKNCPLCNSNWEYQKTMDKNLETIKVNQVTDTILSTPLNLPPLNVTSSNVGVIGDNITIQDGDLVNQGSDIFSAATILGDQNITGLTLSPISHNTSSIIGNMSQLDNQMIDMEESIIDDEEDGFDDMPELEGFDEMPELEEEDEFADMPELEEIEEEEDNTPNHI